MKFKVGDSVKIISNRRAFYKSVISLTVYVGILESSGSVFAVVLFDNKRRSVFTCDLDLAGNQQLLFDFME